MKKLIAFITVGVALVAASASSATVDKITICHGAGQEGTTQYVTLELPYEAVYGQGGHFNENGTTQAGHEQDYLGECQGTEEPPVDPPVDPPVNPPVVPPVVQDCVYTGAGKDGQVDAFGGSNNDCAPLPGPPVVTTTPPSERTVIVEKVVFKDKIVNVVKIKYKTKVKTVVKYKTIVKTVKVKVFVPRPDKPTVKKCPPFTKLYKGICAAMGNG